MTVWSHAVVGLAIAAAAVAQWPAPSSQPATAPPAAEQPVTSAEGGTVVTAGDGSDQRHDRQCDEHDR
jgi:hypothetical protein